MCLLTLELVALQTPDLACQVRRKHVKFHVLHRRRVAGEFRTPFVTRRARLGNHVAQSPAFGFDHFVERFGDLIEDAAEVVLIEDLAAPLAQLVEHLADPFEVASIAVCHSTLHDPAQGAVDVAVIQQIVGQLVEEAVRVEFEGALCAVPRRVAEMRWLATISATSPTEDHGETLTRPDTSTPSRRLYATGRDLVNVG